MSIELSNELYVSEFGFLTERETNQEVLGLSLIIDTKRGEASFIYITELNQNDEHRD